MGSLADQLVGDIEKWKALGETGHRVVAPFYHGDKNKKDVLKPSAPSFVEDSPEDVQKMLVVNPRRVAALASIGDYTDRDLLQRLDPRTGTLSLREMRPGALKEIYDRPGWIHEVDPHAFGRVEGMDPDYERVSLDPVKVENARRIRNVLEEMRRAGVVTHEYDPSSRGYKKAVKMLAAMVRDMPPENRARYLKWMREGNTGLADALAGRLGKAAALKPSARAHIKTSNFGLPSKARTKEQKEKSGNYPIHDAKHARLALAYGAKYLPKGEYAALKSRVAAKYPGMGKQADAAGALRTALKAELDAVNLYERLAKAESSNRKLADLLLDVAREEKVHAGEFEAMLKKVDRQHGPAAAEGAGEVAKIGKTSDGN